MLLVILRHFGGYTVESLLNIPFCHFTSLFELAEKAESFERLAILVGTNIAGTQGASDLYAVENMRFNTKSHYKATVTQEAKDRAEQYVRNRNV